MADRTVSVRLQAEIGQYVSGMSKASAATMRLGDTATASSTKARSGFDMAGKGALLLGGAVVAGLGMAVSKSMEFEAAMSGAAAATGVTGAALKDLREAAMRAGADTQYSATEAAQAITEMGKAGVSTADILNGGLDGALALAAAGQLDVAKAAEIASVAMTQFKLSGDELPHVADLLAAGAGKAMGSVEDLGMALNQAGLLASQSGISIEETTGTLAAFASAGLIGSDAGTSFKTMLQKLQNPSEAAATTLSDLGINMYNAQGQFVGMESLAGQLRTGMEKLTPAVRDAAMAQIFGSDAVRAANVLYTEGAEGIAEWTDKVNDQGYAAEQAAALNDNLKGDLERLGGAFDTLMISVGSGLQGPLRGLTEMLTGLVDGASWAIDAFAGLDAPVQIAIGAIGAFALLKNPVVEFAETAYLKVLQVKDAATEFATSADTARTAMGNMMSAAVPFVAVAAIAWAATKTFEVATAAGDAREEIRAMWGAVDDSRGLAQLDALGGVIDQIEDKIKSLNEELPKTEGAFQGILAPLGMLENGEAVHALDEYQEALQRAEEAQQQATRTANTLGNWFGLNRDQVLDLAEKYDIDLTQGTQNAYMQFQAFYTSEFGNGPMSSTRKLTESLTTMADVTATAEERIDALKTALDILGGATVSVFEAQSALQSVVESAEGALKDLTGSVLDGNGKLNAYSESGRAAGDILVSIRDKGNDLITTMVEQGATLDEVRAADAQLRDSFIRSATQMGISQEAANRLADEILGVPTERETRFTAATDQAAAKIAALQAQINEVSRDRTASINFRATLPDLNGSVSGNGRPGLATGGYVRGPGSGTSDSIPVNLSDGEYVIKASRVRDLGVSTLDDINAGRRGFAAGGLVQLLSDADTANASAGLGRTMNSLGSSVEAAAQRLAAASAMGPIGSGAAGGSWQALWAKVHAAFPSARMTSNFRPGDPGYHGKGKAVDVAGAARMDTSMMYKINKWAAATMGGSLSQLIYTPGINLLNGKPHTYNAATRADHYDHVHMATYDTGGLMKSGTAGINLSGFPERVLNPRETAAYEAGMRAREFSGGSSSGGVVMKLSLADLDGLPITGRFVMEPDGLVRIVDGRIDARQSTTARNERSWQ